MKKSQSRIKHLPSLVARLIQKSPGRNQDPNPRIAQEKFKKNFWRILKKKSKKSRKK
jgi:hypothetical protein